MADQARAGSSVRRFDRERHGQRVSSSTDGDCYRAAMSVLLDVPNGEHLPTFRTQVEQVFGWRDFLAEMGLSTMSSHAKGPIWKDHFWIATVPSKNYDDDGVTHAIVMHGQQVAFDPSPHRRYRPRANLLGTDLVRGGTWLEVADASKLGTFVEWQEAHR